MRETKLTLNEAKAQIENERSLSHYNAARVEGLSIALNILARVEQPSEEDTAVMWLILTMGYQVRQVHSVWERVTKVDLPGGPAWPWKPFNPAEEARKLGWEG